MNKNVYRLKRRMSPIESALAANLIYIILVLIFKVINDGLAGMSDTVQYNYVLGGVELAVAVVFWIGYNWYIFRQASPKKQGSYAGYIFLTMLPIMVLTIAMILVVYLVPGNSFTTAWNQFSFLVAPTVFWYMPFGLLYATVGQMLPIAVFMLMCFILVVAFQVVGIAVGSSQRRKMREEAEKEEALQQRVSVKQVAESYVPPKTQKRPEPVRRKAPTRRPKHNINDPFEDDDDEQIIYTEAFTPITDDIIEAANREKREKLKSKMADAVEKRSMTSEVILDKVRNDMEDDLIQSIDITSVNQKLNAARKAVETEVKAQEELKKSVVVSKPQKETTDILEKKVEKEPSTTTNTLKKPETAPKASKTIISEPNPPQGSAKASDLGAKKEAPRKTTSSGPQWVNPATASNRKLVEALKAVGEGKPKAERRRTSVDEEKLARDKEATQDITMQLAELRKKIHADSVNNEDK